MLMPFHLLIYYDMYSPFGYWISLLKWELSFHFKSDCPRDPWACYISASIFLGRPTKESLSQIHRCENIQGRVFVSHNKSVEWRQWDFWLRFPEFNYAHFQLHWTVLRWGSLNLVSAFISRCKPRATLLPCPEPAVQSDPPSMPWAHCPERPPFHALSPLSRVTLLPGPEPTVQSGCWALKTEMGLEPPGN